MIAFFQRVRERKRFNKIMKQSSPIVQKIIKEIEKIDVELKKRKKQIKRILSKSISKNEMTRQMNQQKLNELWSEVMELHSMRSFLEGILEYQIHLENNLLDLVQMANCSGILF